MPCKRDLQQVTSNLDVTLDFQKILSYILSTLNKRDKIMSLLVGEKYLKCGLQYKSKKITGHTVNDANTLAKTLHL